MLIYSVGVEQKDWGGDDYLLKIALWTLYNEKVLGLLCVNIKYVMSWGGMKVDYIIYIIHFSQQGSTELTLTGFNFEENVQIYFYCFISDLFSVRLTYRDCFHVFVKLLIWIHRSLCDQTATPLKNNSSTYIQTEHKVIQIYLGKTVKFTPNWTTPRDSSESICICICVIPFRTVVLNRFCVKDPKSDTH